GDEVTFIGESAVVGEIHQFFGIKQTKLKSVVIVGGSLVGLNLAKILQEEKVDVRIIDKDFEKCRVLSEQLPNCTIMNHDGTVLVFLLYEKVGRADVFVACTRNDELNLLMASLGKQAGCQNIMVVISNNSYHPIVHQLGITYAISPRTSTAKHILSLAI